MAFKEPVKPHGAGPRMGTSSVRIVPARGRVAAHPEFRVAQDWLYLTLAAPEIPQGKFRYSLRTRYLLVWAEGSRRGEDHFVILPRPVDPKEHAVRFRNGVLDARIRLRRD